ncbi:MAG: quinone-dependent dihydroorotate dehydrogenase [Sporocytophaga sp.]|uniref:quinone-dependent dihydroorotate dehydrogenase n=1 Tax=Sporocytophaga sp. TaxID=2231183 RepID=UPI001B199C75|nr:quinone-dependent dihydroorotate dehydrogenase [Sporocytophaga sp.]MBO9699165.1 quinone-dependent dihydroorotate dehydrogenase [Sporocytophaga sp.]
MYKRILRPLLFQIDPEKVHHLTFDLVRFFFKIPGISLLFKLLYRVKDKRLERKVFGITFPNPVGLAAGFDKDARLFNELSCMGFGFVEIGTLTPKPQPGNDKPRLFRLREDEAIINRMGFNNEGVEAAVARLKNRKEKVIIGGNIGKNKVTSNEDAVKDYEYSFEVLFDYVDYFVVNVSSPNTPNLRALQDKEPLTQLLRTLKERNFKKSSPKPILLKIAPDLTNEQLDDVISILKDVKIEGIIATNTTISRSGLKTDQAVLDQIGTLGGLSGKPLHKRSVEVVEYLVQKSGNAFPVIAVGGIHSAEDAMEMFRAGAALVQLYTGFIYEGPALVSAINKKLLKEK